MNYTLFISMPAAGELLIIGVILLALIVWILAIIDIAKSDFGNDTTKIVWLLVVIFLGVIGAVIYNIAGKQSRINHN